MGSIRAATPQALPILPMTFNTSNVFGSWWWDLLSYFFLFFPFAVNTKIKITWTLLPSKSCFVPPGALGNRLRVFASLNDAVIVFYGSCVPAGEVREGNPCETQQHPPTHLWAFSSCCFGKKNKMKAQGFVPWDSICAFPIDFQTESSLQPSTGMDYCAHKIHSCAGGSSKKHWLFLDVLIPSGFPSPGGGCQLRSPGIFCKTSVVTSRKCSLWNPRADCCLLWTTGWKWCFYSRLPSKGPYFWWYIERKV